MRTEGGWAVVDAFIKDTGRGLGDWFTASELRKWMSENKLTEFNASACLADHRYSPGWRATTTERYGWGRGAHHKIIAVAKLSKRGERKWKVEPDSVHRMDRRQCEEFLRHWLNERRYRMSSIATESPKAKRLLEEAETRIAEALTVLGIGLDEL